MPDTYSDFRSFVLKKHPNLSKAQLKQLDDFVTSQKKADKENIDLELKLKSDLNKELGEIGFDKVQGAINRVRSVEENKEGDLSLIYSYIKMLDPDSVVREGEIALTSQAPSVAQKLSKMYNRVAQGRLLTPKERANTKSQAEQFYAASVDQAQPILESYTKAATEYGVKPDRVLGHYSDVKPVVTPPGLMEEETQQQEGPLSSILKTVFPQTTQLAGDVVEQTKGQLTGEIAPKTSDIRDVVSSLGGPLAGLLLQSPAQKTVQPAAEEVLSRGALLKGGMSLLGKGKNLIGLPKKVAADRAAEAVKVGKINTKELIDAGNNYVKNIDPSARKSWKVLKTSLKKTTDAPELLKKITNWGNQAYTRAGDVRTIAEGGLKNELYSTGRKVIQDQAPTLAEKTSQLRFLHEAPKQIQKGLTTGLKLTGLGRLLGL